VFACQFVFTLTFWLLWVSSVLAQSTQLQKLTLVDTSRCRYVPVALYTPVSVSASAFQKVAVISHGYGGHHIDYSFLADGLVKLGYVVASIQHEIPGDEPLPTTGEARVVRMPNWERGATNIRFALRMLKRLYANLDVTNVLLVGHSNGGDQSMLYARLYPNDVAAVVSLDNRRMPLPRAKRPRILCLRSNDQQPDPGVLPTYEEQRRYGITIMQQNIAHNDMWDGATQSQRQAMLEAINWFLEVQ
jgi:pimeloyl-ACP methyl ester carboxylesterase